MTNRIDEMSSETLAERVAAGAVVLLPVGASEAHGPHLPLGTDRLCAEGFCAEVAKRLDAVIAPAVPWGYRSQLRTGGGSHWTGNIGLDGALLSGIVRTSLTELAHKGMTRIAVLNGHYENVWFITEGIELAVQELGAQPGGDFRVLATSWWEMVDTADLAACFPRPPGSIEYEHGALLETSILLAMHPELVALERMPEGPFKTFPPYDVFPQDPARANAWGSLATSEGASAESGTKLIRLIADRMAKGLRDELGAADARGA